MHDVVRMTGSIYINVPPRKKADSGNLVVCLDEMNDDFHRKRIEVVSGSLFLFPSCLLHYTIPFESNEDRIVLAFDIIPTV